MRRRTPQKFLNNLSTTVWFIGLLPTDTRSGADLSVVKHGGEGQSGQAIKLFQAPQAPCFYLPFLTQVFHPWWTETCRTIQQQFWRKECDILGGQNILWPLLHIFRGSRPKPVQDLRPCRQTNTQRQKRNVLVRGRRKKKKNLFAVNNNNNACSCNAQLIRRATREAVAHQMLAALVTQYSILYYNKTDDR